MTRDLLERAVIVTGSRKWTAAGYLTRMLANECPSHVITGGCQTGADAIAEQWARFWEKVCTVVPARWRTIEGKRAGPLRNIRMLEMFPEALVLAFPLGESPGTRHCIREAEKRGMTVKVFEGKP